MYELPPETVAAEQPVVEPAHEIIPSVQEPAATNESAVVEENQPTEVAEPAYEDFYCCQCGQGEEQREVLVCTHCIRHMHVDCDTPIEGCPAIPPVPVATTPPLPVNAEDKEKAPDRTLHPLKDRATPHMDPLAAVVPVEVVSSPAVAGTTVEPLQASVADNEEPESKAWTCISCRAGASWCSLCLQMGRVVTARKSWVSEGDTLMKCSRKAKCHNFLHHKCLKKYATDNRIDPRYFGLVFTKKKSSMRLVCPAHVCAACALPVFKKCKKGRGGGELLRCVFCAHTYHQNKCLPPSHRPLEDSVSFIICGDHPEFVDPQQKEEQAEKEKQQEEEKMREVDLAQVNARVIKLLSGSVSREVALKELELLALKQTSDVVAETVWAAESAIGMCTKFEEGKGKLKKEKVKEGEVKEEETESEVEKKPKEGEEVERKESEPTKVEDTLNEDTTEAETIHPDTTQATLQDEANTIQTQTVQVETFQVKAVQVKAAQDQVDTIKPENTTQAEPLPVKEETAVESTALVEASEPKPPVGLGSAVISFFLREGLQLAFDIPDAFLRLVRARPAPFRRVRTNVYSTYEGRCPVADRSVLMKCNCKSNHEQDRCGTNSCINRALHVECTKTTCGFGPDECRNRRMQLKQYPKLKVIRTKGRGFGLVVMERVEPGDLIVEYVGEIINKEQCEARLERMEEMEDENFYFLQLDKDAFIDAGPTGNLARFANHSCDPNCETQKWQTGKRYRVGIFAMQTLEEGTEVTYDYHFERFSTHHTPCRCNAKNCSKIFGARPLQDAKPNKKRKLTKLQEKRAAQRKKEDLDEKRREEEMREKNKRRKLDNQNSRAERVASRAKRAAINSVASAEKKKRRRKGISLAENNTVKSVENVSVLKGEAKANLADGVKKEGAKENVDAVVSECVTSVDKQDVPMSE